MNNIKRNNPLTYILLGKRSGKTCAKIIEKLLIRPYNPNQLANVLDLNYNTVHYHIRVMEKYDLIEQVSTGYGSMYFASQKLRKESEKFYELQKLI